jgi:uncharacterized membrane protein YkvA (DUF1232 family)
MGKPRMPQHWLTVVLIFLLLAACITYIVTPDDIIPDYRGWTGWIDDVLVAIFCLVLSAIAVLFILPKGVSCFLVFIPAVCALYILWTFDLIPDFIPFFGWLDDVGAALMGVSSFVKGLKGAFNSFSEKSQVNQIEISDGEWEDIE